VGSGVYDYVMPALPELLTVDEVANALRVSRSTVYEWVAAKRIPFVKLSHKVLRFRPGDLALWIEAKTVSTVLEVGDGSQTTRRGVDGRLPVPGSRDGRVEALPAFDWSRDDQA